MNTEQYIRAKNELVFRVTGHILVPEDQIVNEPKVKIYKPYYADVLSDRTCPYCVRRTYDEDITDCSTCPMFLGGNGCVDVNDSTWIKCYHLWNELATGDDKEKLKQLVREYNSY